MLGIIGRKLGMTQIIEDDGRVIPVTYVLCDPNEVVHVKTEKTDGYPAIVLGFGAYKNPSKTKKFKVLKEFRVNKSEDYKVGQKISVEMFNGIASVTVTGRSKGKGFQGVIKRHNFSRGPETHGSGHHREGGSIGMCAKPGRVIAGKRMAGHMGDETVTLKNRPLVSVVPGKNVLGIKGSIPGSNNSYVYIKTL